MAFTDRLLPQGGLCRRADTELLKEKLALLVEEGRAWGRKSRGERPGEWSSRPGITVSYDNPKVNLDLIRVGDMVLGRGTRVTIKASEEDNGEAAEDRDLEETEL